MPRGTPLRIVGTDSAEVERALAAGELDCPACEGRLRPWGSARQRVVRGAGGEQRRRPRRTRCDECRVTHVLIWEDTLLRRRDEVTVIGAALAAKAAGHGHRWSAAVSGVPVSTVRGWLRRFAASVVEIRGWFTVLAHDLDRLLGPVQPQWSVFADAVEAVGVAARAAVLRLGVRAPWSFASAATGGRLLSNTGCPWVAIV